MILKPRPPFLLGRSFFFSATYLNSAEAEKKSKTKPKTKAAAPGESTYEGLRSEPRKKDVRQPNQMLSGLRVRNEFQERGGDNSDSMNYSDVSDVSDDEDESGFADGTETGGNDESGQESSEEVEGDDDSGSDEPDFEDLVK